MFYQSNLTNHLIEKEVILITHTDTHISMEEYLPHCLILFFFYLYIIIQKSLISNSCCEDTFSELRTVYTTLIVLNKLVFIVLIYINEELFDPFASIDCFEAALKDCLDPAASIDWQLYYLWLGLERIYIWVRICWIPLRFLGPKLTKSRIPSGLALSFFTFLVAFSIVFYTIF